MEDLSGFQLKMDGNTHPMVSFRKERKAYGALVVLDDLDLDVAAGEMVSGIGPSGSGKSEHAVHHFHGLVLDAYEKAMP